MEAVNILWEFIYSFWTTLDLKEACRQSFEIEPPEIIVTQRTPLLIQTCIDKEIVHFYPIQIE